MKRRKKSDQSYSHAAGREDRWQGRDCDVGCRSSDGPRCGHAANCSGNVADLIRTTTANWRTIASAVVSDGIAIVPYGRGEFLAGVRVGGSGDITKSRLVFGRRAGRGKSADVPTPVVVGDKAYLLNDKGRIACVNMKTGDEIWTARPAAESQQVLWFAGVGGRQAVLCARGRHHVRWPSERQRF